MTGSNLEKLFFTVALIDKVTKPAKGVSNALLKIQKNARIGLMDIGKGALSIGAASVALSQFTTPAIEFSKALGEVASLGVPEEELAGLGKASKAFAMRYGEDATAVARSAYDIQSAIPGLQKGALAAFTVNGALLAKATKADISEITAYQGQMYNIFSKDVKNIGAAQWIENLTGKTALAVEMFMTTGPAMKAAFSNLGSMGALLNVSMDEQMGVLGTLQSAGMGGANAGTAYKAMLGKMSQSQQALGMNFKGTDGNLLPIYEIVDKIQSKIGNLDKDRQVEQLSKAFGEEGAKAVMNMIGKTDKLKKDIEAIQKITGNKKALEMAEAMRVPMKVFQSTLKVISITIGTGILPALNAVLGFLSTILGGVNSAIESCFLVRWVVNILIGLTTAFGIAWGVFWVFSGIGSLWKAFAAKLKLIGTLLRYNHIITRQMTFSQKLLAISTALLKKTMAGLAWGCKKFGLTLLWSKAIMIGQAVVHGVMAATTWLMSTGFWAVCAAVWAFSAALWANPITWVIMGIVALIAVIVGLIVYWDKVTQIAGVCWDLIVKGALWCGELLLDIAKWMFAPWLVIGDLIWMGISWVFEKISGAFSAIWAPLEKIWNFFSGDNKATLELQNNAAQPVISDVVDSRRNDGGKITNRNSQQSVTNNWGGVSIAAGGGMSPAMMEEWALMNG